MFNKLLSVLMIIANVVVADEAKAFLERLTGRLHRAGLNAWADLVGTFPLALKTTIELSSEMLMRDGGPAVGQQTIKLTPPAPEPPVNEYASPPVGTIGKVAPSHPSQGNRPPPPCGTSDPDEPVSHADMRKAGDPEPDPERMPTP